MHKKYRQFIELKNAGFKKQANQAAKELVAEYLQAPDEEFLVAICETADDRIDHQIWSGLVLPLALSDRKNPVVLKCLIQTTRNLLSDDRAWKQLGWVTEQRLVDEYLELVPGDPWAITRKKRLIAKWLSYVIHEWPTGILYGVDGAGISECDEILGTVSELISLDSDSEYKELCDDVSDKTQRYREYLKTGDSSKLRSN